MKITKRLRIFGGVIVAVVMFASSTLSAAEKKFERIEKLPTGSNTSVLGTFTGGMMGLNNKTEMLIAVPYDTVWTAAKIIARDFAKNGGRQIVAVDEQNNRIQNGRIDENAMTGRTGLDPFVDEFVTEITMVSDHETKIAINRNIMQKESRHWAPQKSNGRIERYLITRIMDKAVELPPTSALSTDSGPPRDYAATAAGTYLREGKPADFIELGSDGNCFVKQNGRSAVATYKVSGNIATLVLPNGTADRARFDGDSLTDSDGIVWVKKAQTAKPMAQTSSLITNDQIIQMVAAKLPDDVIVTSIRSSNTKFDFAPDALIKLKAANVSDVIIRAMADAIKK